MADSDNSNKIQISIPKIGYGNPRRQRLFCKVSC